MSDKTTCTSAGTGTPVTTQTICSRPFIAYEHGIGDDLDPFAKDKIEAKLQERLMGKSFPDQGDTFLCGPAAFFYCLQIKHPAFYRMAVQQLWTSGEADIAHLRIRPDKDCLRPKNFFDKNGQERISGLDWMTLASLRDTGNLFIDYQSPNDFIAPITMPSKLIQWFRLVGFPLVKQYLLPGINDLFELNDYFVRGYNIVSLVSGGIIDGQPKPFKPLPTHWVVWSSTLNGKNNKPITKSIKGSDSVNLTLFSWGENKKPIKKFSLDEFHDYSFQHYVFRA